MRFLLLLGLSIAPLSLGCMVAAKGAPPPGPSGGGMGSVSVPKDSPPGGDAGNKKLEEAPKESKEDRGEKDSRAQDSADDESGAAFGEGGLGMTGTGTGGGGTGQGIGLGAIGTVGHGAGTGSGSGYGSGSGGGGSGKHGRVAAATATTSGAGLAPEIIQRIVRQNLSQIQSCYDTAMAKSPSLAGKVAVKFVIDAKGAVTTASAADTNITDADMVSCVVGAVKRMSFPQPDGGSLVVVTYPFNFSSGDN